jgi:predicted nucleic acid-binding protein
MPSSVYWDACLFLEALQKKNDDKLNCCLAMIESAKKGDLVIVTSAFTFSEVIHLEHLEETEGISREEQTKMILEFFENPFISVRPLDRQIGEMACQFTCTHSPLTGSDAIHVATAIVAKVDALYTWDVKKGRKRRGLLIHDGKIGTPPLRIQTPPDPRQGTLFDEKNIVDPENPGDPDAGETKK